MAGGIGAEQIRQSRWGVTTRFTFGDDRLGYRIADVSSRETDYAWDAIDCTSLDRITIKARRPIQLLSALTYALAIGSLLANNYLPRFGIAAAVLCLVALLVLVLVRTNATFAVTFTDIAVPGGPIRIIVDRQHDAILARIEDAQRAFLRRTLAVLDLTAETDAEAHKFDWLLDRGVIDAREHGQAIAQLMAADAMKHVPSGTLN